MATEEANFDIQWMIGMADGIPRQIREMELPDFPTTDDEVARCLLDMHGGDNDATVAACGLYALARKEGNSMLDAYGMILERLHTQAHCIE